MAISHSPAVHKFKKVLSDIAESNSFTNYEVKFEHNGNIADGYTSNIDRAKILMNNNELDLLIKSCGSNDQIRSVMPISVLFNREKYMYETIFPILQKFEIDHGRVPTQFAPTYYKGYSDKHDGDVIILNNLKSSGYTIHDRTELFDDHHIKLLLRNYALLHAASFAYKYHYPSLFHTMATEPMPDLHSVIFKKSGLGQAFLNQLKKAGASLNAQLGPEVKIVYEKFIQVVEPFLYGLDKNDNEFTTITHGDCWKNNFLFRYGDNNNSSMPTDVRMIDFQVSKVGSPMLDIANFFYGGGSKEVLDHVNTYLDMYYSTLSKCLEEFGCNAEEVYPRSVMMAQWKKFAKYGLIVRVSVLAIIFSDDSERKGISDVVALNGNIANLFDYTISDVEKFEELSKHSINHFVDNHLI